MVQKINVDSDHLSKDSDTEEKTFKRPILPKVTLFGYNLLLASKSVVGTHSWSILWTASAIPAILLKTFARNQSDIWAFSISILVIFTLICISANFLLIRAFCKFANLRTAC